jgi:hypothetical protein
LGEGPRNFIDIRIDAFPAIKNPVEKSTYNKERTQLIFDDFGLKIVYFQPKPENKKGIKLTYAPLYPPLVDKKIPINPDKNHKSTYKKITICGPGRD